MLNFPQSSLSGKTQQASDNTQKQQLTDQQKRLIEDNYREIEKTLKELLKTLKRKLGIRNLNFDSQSGLSYSVEAALKFNPNITPIEHFAKYAAYTCFYRMIDESRRMHKYAMVGGYKNRIISKYIEKSMQKFGFANEQFIVEQLCDHDLDSEDLRKMNQVKQLRLKLYEDYKEVTYEDEGLHKEEKEEKLKFLKAQSDIYFVNKGCKLTRIRKALVDDYILPKLQGKEYKNLTQISKEHNDISLSRLSQMLRDENIKNFLMICYREKDKNGIPIIK